MAALVVGDRAKARGLRRPGKVMVVLLARPSAVQDHHTPVERRLTGQPQ
jgi:hypothetical protein